MHELSVCQSLMQQVCNIAEHHHAHSVERIYLQVGPLSGVEPELLQSAFAVASRGSIAEGADLVIDACRVRILCRSCGAQTETAPNRLVCGGCGDWHTQLLSGDELMLQRIELNS